MHNGDFEPRYSDALPSESYDLAQQERWVRLAAGLSVLFAVAAGVMMWLARRRQPTRLRRAEAALARGAGSVEQAARTVRKQGPGLITRGAESVEQAARSVRKQGPAYVAMSGARVEQ